MACHVAIMHRGYLKLILQGRKTMESRLTRWRLPPWGKASAGDVIYFKQTSGPFRCKAVIHRVHFYDNLTPEKIDAIRKQYNHTIAGADDYWQAKRNCRYATLLELADVTAVTTGPAFPRSHGQAWFVLDDSAAPASVR